MLSDTFLGRFDGNAHRIPDSPALQWRGEPVSYRALRAAAERMRGELGSLPAGPVVVMSPKSPETIALVLGCWLAGRPVLLPAADLGDGLLQRLADRAGCVGVVRPTPGMKLSDAAVTIEPLDATMGQCGDRAESVAADTLLILATSGSTGMPKIVPLTTDGVDAFHDWAIDQFALSEGITTLSYAPLNFDLSLLDVWAALAAGGTCALVEPSHAMDGRRLARTIRESGADVVQAVPMMFGLLGAATSTQVFAHVSDVIVTGDVASPAVLRALTDLFPCAKLFNVYGCTETNDSVLHEFSDIRSEGGGALPIGWPLPGVHTRVVDHAGGALRGAAVGQLLVSTPFQARGYLDPDLTRDRFVADPSGATDAVFFRTGDIVRRTADGLLYLEGRDDHHVKVRGVRTNVAEVEHVLTQHPQVEEAAVVAVADDQVGHRLHAMIRRASDSELTSLTLRSHCAGLLPRTAIPSQIHLVDHPLPLTSTGKFDRTTIRNQMTAEPARAAR